MLTRHLLPVLKARKSKSGLAIVASVGPDLPPLVGMPGYVGSKAYNKAFSLCLETELRDTNVEVFCIQPGAV